MPNRIDLVGRKFGLLSVVKYDGRMGNDTAWICRCDCGEGRRIRGDHLRSGATTSCGCYRTKHGASGTPEYVTWKGIKTRCTNKNEPGWKNYGGRGISVCRRWLEGDGKQSGFECFLADVGKRPSENHSIDRYPDNDGNYEPDNCRWATPKEQANNRRPRSSKIAA